MDNPLRSLCPAKLFSDFLLGLSRLQGKSQELLITALFIMNPTRYPDETGFSLYLASWCLTSLSAL